MKFTSIIDVTSAQISGEWGKAPSSRDTVKVLRTTNFTNVGKLNLSSVVEREISRSVIERKRLIGGDIIIEKSGGSPNQPVGRVVYFDINDDNVYLCNNFTTILRPSKSILPKYLFYRLYYLHVTNRTLKYQNKTTGIINLKLNRYLKEEKIPVPSFEEQRHVVESLDVIDSLCSKRLHSIKLTDEYIRSVFYELFGDPIKNTMGWDKKPLGSFGKISTGNTPPRNDSDNYAPKYIEWIKTNNIVEDEILITQAEEYLSEKGLSKARFVSSGAVFVACIAGSIASIGRAAMTNRRVSFNQQINAIQPNDDTNPVFLYWLIKLSKKQVQNYASKGMKKIITKGVFEKINMISPPIDLQNRFALIANEAGTIKQHMKDQSKSLDIEFQAVIQKAFSDKN